MRRKELSSISLWSVITLAALLAAWGCEPRAAGVMDVQPPPTLSGEQNGQGGKIFDPLEAMTTAIQDEYHAFYTYDGVLDALGEDTGPFDNIVLAEDQHVKAMVELFVDREWEIPESDWDETNVPLFSTRVGACIGGVEAENKNIAMYDDLLLLELPLDVREVFLNLQAASKDHHLPAFTACSVIGPIEAMEIAIQDEYRAQATYGEVLEDLGLIAPFMAIEAAEVEHMEAVAGLFTKRELPVPDSQWDDTNVETFKSRSLACAGGVLAETANVAMYDGLLEPELPEDVRMVFENLRSASLDHHLPAFIACAPPGLGSPSP